MNVIFFTVDNVLNFEGSDAKAPDGSKGIAEARVKALKKLADQDGSRVVLCGSWNKHWNFDDAKCTSKGVYLNKKLERRGLHILDKTKDFETVQEQVDEWLNRHPNVESWKVLTNGEMLSES